MAFALSVSGLGLDLGLGFEALVLAVAFNILALTCTRSHDNSILCSKAFLCSCVIGSSGACTFSGWSAYKNVTELGSLTRCWNHLFSGSATCRTDKLRLKKIKYFSVASQNFGNTAGLGLGNMALALAQRPWPRP